MELHHPSQATAKTETLKQLSGDPLGLLKVDIGPAGLGVDVVLNGVPRNQFGLYFFLAAGTYEVCGTDLGGWVTPLCQSVTVSAGTQTGTTLTYTPA